MPDEGLKQEQPRPRRVISAYLACAATLVVAGALLIGRPLTTLLVLGHALFPVTLLAQWSLPPLISALPAALAAVLAVACVLAVTSVFRRRGGLRRGTSAAWAVAAAVGAWLALTWPDAALVAVAYAASVSAVSLGVALAVRTLRARRRAGGRVAGSRGRRQGWRLAAALVAAVVALALGLGSLQLLGRVPAAGPFYSWDGDLPGPGSLLAVEPYDGAVPEGATAHRILYMTTYSDGSTALASAVVAVPDAPADGERLVLAWQHGTTGVARPCAPSLGPDALTEEAIPGATRAIERGWVIVATDYPGQGTAGRFPYLIGVGQGHATLDAIRAVRQLDGADASSRALLWGHSQGGHATLWAGQLASTYAPELQVVGVAALSSASDPLAVARSVLASGSGPLADIVTSLVLVPYADEYRDITLDDTVHPAGHAIVQTYASRCATQANTLVSALTGLATARDAPLYELNLDSGPTHDRLRENIADAVFDAPLFLGQGVDDEVIPIQVQRDLTASLCSAGRTVEAHEYPGRSHMGAIAADSPLPGDLFAWTDAVLAGQRPDTC